MVKERDHLCDATRYLCLALLNICRTEPPKKPDGVLEFPFHRGGFGSGGNVDGRASASQWQGAPRRGAGAIYPVPESDIVIPDFEIPEHWPSGLDVAPNRTAAGWGALDRETDVLYLYLEHGQGEAEPSVHAQAIRARGAWFRGAIHPAARWRSQVDGLEFTSETPRSPPPKARSLSPAEGETRFWLRLDIRQRRRESASTRR